MLESGRRLADLPERLERAFEESMEEWWALGRELAGEPSARWAHAPACTPNASDLGLMLAWTRLADDCAAKPQTSLIVCDDPWLFRHLRTRPGVAAGRPPCLWRPVVRAHVRGALARLRRVVMLAVAAIGRQASGPVGASSLLVYAHPQSRADGHDAYFGAIMKQVPGLVRMLHTDAAGARAAMLADGNETFSLHGWGNPVLALGLIFTRWRPAAAHVLGRHGWLVRRAAALEGANAQAVMTRWQGICQRAWMRKIRPMTVTWPWENHAWERELVRAARKLGVATIGYQHTVVGRHAANHSPRSNPDGLDSIPDRIFCNSRAGRDQLRSWGIPAERLAHAGTLRDLAPKPIEYDPQGPVFVALPMKQSIALEMLAALQRIRTEDLRFVLKVHPMTELDFPETGRISRTEEQLHNQGGLRAVVYSATSVGLEAILAGLPTLRFLPASTIAIDILSPPAEAVSVTAETLEPALKNLTRTSTVDIDDFFPPADLELWRSALVSP